jgi:hypothetical protein
MACDRQDDPCADPLRDHGPYPTTLSSQGEPAIETLGERGSSELEGKNVLPVGLALFGDH